MTTTSSFQKKPDYYLENINFNIPKIQTNPKYKDFNQTHFTAGDFEQFEKFRDKKNGNTCKLNVDIDIDKNKFQNIDLSEYIKWEKYKKIDSRSVDNTFNYMFNKFKKGIFVKIADNRLKVFLPFSKKDFVNEWSDKIKIDPTYGSMYNYEKYINSILNKKYRISVNSFTETWYYNNCLVRSEFPIREGDTNTPSMSDMLIELCKYRKIPDIEFFVNRRDFPLLKRDGTEAYNHIFGESTNLVSHNYSKYSPILSMVTRDDYSDIPIPTGDDWSRISRKEGKYFEASKTAEPNDYKKYKWTDKISVAVFRGASTGCGVTVETNPRLKLSRLSVLNPTFLNAGITKWQLRPRKLSTEKYLTTINVKDMNGLGIFLAPFMSVEDQTQYKYIVNVDGHVSAFRLSLELSMGCCILLVKSKYKLWYSSMLEPMIHYVPIKEDLSDLIDQIKWCRENDDKCLEISKNSRKFYKKYLDKDGALDYLQKILIDLKKYNGSYIYNEKSPLDMQIKLEKENNDSLSYYPKINGIINNLPKQSRSFGVLKCVEWLLNYSNSDGNSFELLAIKSNTIALNVVKYKLAGFSLTVKSNNKEKENIHEVFVGINGINDIVKYIPNFRYVFGKTKDYSVVSEFVNGETFDKWLISEKFNVKEYIFIIIQIAMALKVAQKNCMFVHNNLVPSKVVIQILPVFVDFDYVTDFGEIYRIKTNIIPVLISYSKTHIVKDMRHHGFEESSLYSYSTIKDILTIILHSLKIIVNLRLNPKDLDDIVKISNFVSGTNYRKLNFKKSGINGLSDIKFFLNSIKTNYQELEKKNPMDFIGYVNKVIDYDYSISKVEYPTFRINRGNPLQVFEYVFSSTVQEKINSFKRVFERVISCDFELPDNRFMAYYSSQTLEECVKSVYTLMLQYVKLEKSFIDLDTINKVYNESLKKIDAYYGEENLKKYKLSDTYLTNQKIEYNEKQPTDKDFFIENNTFSSPKEVLKLLKNSYDFKLPEDSMKSVKTIENVMMNNGNYRLTVEHKEYYKDNFKDFFLNFSEDFKYLVDLNTLRSVSKELFNLENANCSKDFLKIKKLLF
jgi:hypothetical protein